MRIVEAVDDFLAVTPTLPTDSGIPAYMKSTECIRDHVLKGEVQSAGIVVEK